MRFRRIVISLVWLLVPVGLLSSFESQLLEVLSNSDLSREADIDYQIKELEARAQGQTSIPVLYLSAPEAYSFRPLPDAQHLGKARLGIRGELPYGLTADLSWNHSLDYLTNASDFAGSSQDGFLQSFSAQVSLSVPLYFGKSPFIGASMALNTRDQAGLQQTIARNQLARSYIQDWFVLYRKKLSFEFLALQEQAAFTEVEAYEQLVSAGDAALHELWQAQRKRTAIEVNRMQADIEWQKLQEQFLSRYGVNFPEQAIIPSGMIDWTGYGIYPRLSAEKQLASMGYEANQLSYWNERSAAAPRINLGLSLNSPSPTEVKPFWESVSDQFTELGDWSPILSVGLALSTDDLHSASHKKSQYELSLERFTLQQDRLMDDLQAEVHQYERLLEQYRHFLDLEQNALQQMQHYVEDMKLRYEKGEMDLLQLNEILLQHGEMQTSVRQTSAYLREVEMHLQLLGTVPEL